MGIFKSLLFVLLLTGTYFSYTYIISPTNNSVYFNNITAIKYETNSTGQCWYVLNGVSSPKVVAGNNFSVNLGIGRYNLSVYCNSSAGLERDDSYFIINNFNELKKMQLIISSGQKNYGYFGVFVYSLPNYLFSAAIYEDYSNVKYAGALYMFKKNPSTSIYQEIQRFGVKDPSTRHLGNVGKASYMEGEYLIVGFRNDDDRGENVGAVYVFKKNSSGLYEQIQKIAPLNLNDSDVFGEVVDGYKEYLAISHPNYNSSGGRGGAVYVFRRNSSGLYEEIQKIVPSDVYEYDTFGSDIEMQGTYLIASSVGDDDNGINSGSVYVFRRNSSGLYEEIQKIVANDSNASPLNYEYFGNSLSMSGEYLAVGAWLDGETKVNGGAVYIFKRNSSGLYEQIQKIVPSDHQEGEIFGYSVVLNGDYLFASSPWKDVNGVKDAGAVYIFRRNSSGLYEEIGKIHSDKPTTNAKMGSWITASLRDFFIEERKRDTNYTQGGAVHYYRLFINAGINMSVSPSLNVIYPTTTNVSCSSKVPAILNLKRGNNTTIANSYIEDVRNLSVGGHTYECFVNGDENYSYVSQAVFIIVNSNTSVGKANKREKPKMLVIQEGGKIRVEVMLKEKGMENVKVVLRRKVDSLYETIKEERTNKEGIAYFSAKGGEYKVIAYADGNKIEKELTIYEIKEEEEKEGEEEVKNREKETQEERKKGKEEKSIASERREEKRIEGNSNANKREVEKKEESIIEKEELKKGDKEEKSGLNLPIIEIVGVVILIGVGIAIALRVLMK